MEIACNAILGPFPSILDDWCHESNRPPGVCFENWACGFKKIAHVGRLFFTLGIKSNTVLIVNHGIKK